MKPTDAKLVAGFLLQDLDRFMNYLEDCSIDSTEASVIVEEIIEESDGEIPTCTEQLSGFVGE